MSTTSRAHDRQPWLLAAVVVTLMILILRATHRAYAAEAGSVTALSFVTLAACAGSAASLLVVQRAREMQAVSGLQRWVLGAALAVSPFLVSNAAITLGEPMWTSWVAFAWAGLVLLAWTAWHTRQPD